MKLNPSGIPCPVPEETLECGPSDPSDPAVMGTYSPPRYLTQQSTAETSTSPSLPANRSLPPLAERSTERRRELMEAKRAYVQTKQALRAKNNSASKISPTNMTSSETPYPKQEEKLRYGPHDQSDPTYVGTDSPSPPYLTQPFPEAASTLTLPSEPKQDEKSELQACRTA